LIDQSLHHRLGFGCGQNSS